MSVHPLRKEPDHNAVRLVVQARQAARCVRAHLVDEDVALRVLLRRRDEGQLISYMATDAEVEAAFRAEMAGMALDSTLQGFTWGDRMTAPEHLQPSTWAIRKVLPKECTGLLYGGWGTCKTFLAIDMAGAIANGMPWQGRKTVQGTVFYLAGEGEGGFARRLRAWEIAHGGSMKHLAFREMPNIRNSVELAALLVEIDQLASERGDPALIVIDTLFTALNGGEENGGKDMGEVFMAMRALRQRFQCAVIAVHHTGHDGDRARGHSSMPAGVDVQFYVKAKPVADGSMLELTNPKQKDGSKFDTIHLCTESVPLPGLVDDEGQTETSLVIRQPVAEMLKAARDKDAAKPSLDDLKAKARELRERGMTLERIGVELGRDKSTISAWLKPKL